MSDFSFSRVYDLPTHRASAAFTSKTSEVFKEQHNISPIIINDRMQYIPWGADNMMPYNIIDLIESDETLATCQMFNAEVCYGSGLVYDTAAATAQVQQAVDDFIADNDLASYLLCDCRLHSAMLKQVWHCSRWHDNSSVCVRTSSTSALPSASSSSTRAATR